MLFSVILGYYIFKKVVVAIIYSTYKRIFIIVALI